MVVFILITCKGRKERNIFGANPYEVRIMITNEKCNLPFGLWQAVSK